MGTNRLAIMGGEKTIKDNGRHFVWPVITKKIERLVLKQLYTSISIYNKGGVIEEFENRFAAYHRVKFAVLCNSGTSALHSMYVAADLKPGDEVICPAYTFFATVTPLLFLGVKPILCDCDENGNIDPVEISKKITKKTKGIVVTHMWGIPCQMDKIVRICKANNLLLMEDCSHAHGARYNGKTVGSFGDMAAWSLQGQKIISGGEGGIFITNNEEFYYRVLMLGHYNKRCKQEIDKHSRYYRYAVTGMGLKFRSHPLAVCIANELLKNLDQILKVKRMFAKRMIKQLKKYGCLKMPPAFFDKNIEPAWYAMVFQYNKQGGAPSIELIADALHAEGLAEVDLPGSTCPLNLLSLFQEPEELFAIYKYKSSSFGYHQGEFPKAEQFYRRAIKLPVWAYKKDARIVNLYMKGIDKVVRNIQSIK